jgi:signal transduction histidine kinase
LRALEQHPAEAAEALRTIAVSSRQTLHDVRSMVGTLRHAGQPAPSSAATLACLDDLVAATLAELVEVEVEVTGVLDLLSPAVDEVAYRIIQEALTNVARHADARSVRISIAVEGDVLELTIIDDGLGADTRAPRTGNGIVGMRERAASVGGQLSASGRPGGGFHIRATCPTSETRGGDV